jgi:hypothetical protein
LNQNLAAFIHLFNATIAGIHRMTKYEPVEDAETSVAPSGDAAFALKKANWFYAGKFIIFAIISFILYNTGSTWIGKIINSTFVHSSSIGVSLVARTSFALAIWFAIHSLLMLGNRNVVNSTQFMLHSTWLWIHSIIFLLILAATGFIPDSFFNIYIEFGYVASGIYLLIQAVVLVTFVHEANEKFVADDNLCLVFGLTIFLTASSLTGFGLSYWKFQDSRSVILISVNLAVTIGAYILSIVIEHGSIFTSSLVAVYTAYLTFSGLLCSNPLTDPYTTQGIIFSVVSSILTLIFVGYSASSASSFGSECACPCCTDQEEPKDLPSLSAFHFLYALASVYMLEMVTHWCQGDSVDEQVAPWVVDRGQIATWVNFAASWLTLLLYIWTLIAPSVCPDRDFS